MQPKPKHPNTEESKADQMISFLLFKELQFVRPQYFENKVNTRFNIISCKETRLQVKANVANAC